MPRSMSSKSRHTTIMTHGTKTCMLDILSDLIKKTEPESILFLSLIDPCSNRVHKPLLSCDPGHKDAILKGQDIDIKTNALCLHKP